MYPVLNTTLLYYSNYTLKLNLTSSEQYQCLLMLLGSRHLGVTVFQVGLYLVLIVALLPFPFEFNYCIGCCFFDIKLTAMPKILFIAKLTQWDLSPCWAWYLMPQQVDQTLGSQIHNGKYF